tara:strand:- start:278 stop:619 length:342 start_codon:yes stop_codon:yes gene_type:complete
MVVSKLVENNQSSGASQETPIQGRNNLAEEATRYRVYKDVGPPPPSMGSRGSWSELPLDTISVGDLVEVTLGREEVRSQINAIRSFAGRIARKNTKKFSVRITTYGIGIWRTE